MLTRRQADLLRFIDNHVIAYGVSPSFDEMKEAAKLQSKSGIHRLIYALEERGFIRRVPHRARAIEVIRRPDNQNMITNGLSKEAIDVPVMGYIAAGTPIEAISQNNGNISLPASFLGIGADIYALEVAGDSMIEAGILDGDTVLIRRTDTAQNGDIVVALIDESEATLKYLHHRADKITLEPANETYKAQTLDANRVRVQGRLVGLLRRY